MKNIILVVLAVTLTTGTMCAQKFTKDTDHNDLLGQLGKMKSRATMFIADIDTWPDSVRLDGKRIYIELKAESDGFIAYYVGLLNGRYSTYKKEKENMKKHISEVTKWANSFTKFYDERFKKYGNSHRNEGDGKLYEVALDFGLKVVKEVINLSQERKAQSIEWVKAQSLPDWPGTGVKNSSNTSKKK